MDIFKSFPGEESFLSPLCYSFKKEFVVDTVIGSFNVETRYIHGNVFVFASVKEFPKSYYMVSSAFALSEPGLINELGLGNFVSVDSPHDYVFKDSDKGRLYGKTSEILV